MTTKIKNIDFQVIDFRYDQGIRGRIESSIAPTITTKSSLGTISGVPMLMSRERE